MRSQVLVIHERLGVWARQLRPRLADRTLRVIETRSRQDLRDALAPGRCPCPLVLLDLASNRLVPGLEDLDQVRRTSPDALTLVLDPDRVEGIPLLARELGATHVITGPATPPAVLQLLTRWIPLARRRGESFGWTGSPPVDDEPEPWKWLAPYLDPTPEPLQRPARNRP